MVLPYCMSLAASSLLQRIFFQIVTELQIELRKRNCGKCKVYIPIDWRISADTVVQQPDVIIVCKPITGIRLMEPPTVIFEIHSPSTRQKDQTSKFDLYQE
jgi:Uma2 family endonuclease